MGLKGKLRNNEFVKNAMTLTAGTSIAQLLPILIYPLLSRLYTPDDFGLFSIFASLTSILSVLATGKYEMSVLLAKTKEDAYNVVGLVVSIAACVLLLSLIVLMCLSDRLGVWFGISDLSHWFFLSPLAAFSIIIYNLYNEWSVRSKRFKVLALNKLINSLCVSIGKLSFGVVKIFSAGLVVGDTLGRFLSAVGCAVRMFYFEKGFIKSLSFDQFKKLAIRFSNFPKYYLPSELINTIGGQLPIFLIGYFFSKTEVGYFGMTLSVLSIPVSMISYSVRDTFRQKANENIIATGSSRELFLKTFKVLSVFALCGLVLIFFMPGLFSYVLGEQWRISGQYAQIILPMVLLSFISNSLSGIIVITEKLRVAFWFQIYYFSVTLFSILLGYYLFNDMKFMLLMFAIGRGSAYFLEIFLSYKYSVIDEKEIKE